MSQSELRNFEKSMAYHLAPAMLGIKPACLMSMEKNKDGLEENVELFNSRAYTKGMKLTVLCECKSRKLLFLYNEKLLSDRLADIRVRKLLESFGYDIEELGPKACALRAVPFVFDEPSNAAFFLDIIDTLKDKTLKSIYDTKLDAIATMSCKAAVKGNDKLSFTEAKTLIERMLELENPFNCPHGRPTVIEMTKYELEKKFKRIV